MRVGIDNRVASSLYARSRATARELPVPEKVQITVSMERPSLPFV